MGAGDRPGSVAPPAASTATPAPRLASISIAPFCLDLAAGPGSATLTVALGTSRDEYVLAPGALAAWAEATARLLEPVPTTADSGAELRAPFLLDVEGRPAIAFACAVTEHGAEYRLLVTGASGRIGTAPSDAEMARTVVEAARGVAVAAGAPAGHAARGR